MLNSNTTSPQKPQDPQRTRSLRQGERKMKMEWALDLMRQIELTAGHRQIADVRKDDDMAGDAAGRGS